MHRPLIIANWKMNTSLADAIVLATQVKNGVENLDVDVVLCPPFVWLVPLAEILEHAPANISLGAQNMWFADKGPMTGEISPLMLKGLTKYVILGHSERRLHFGESNALINDKIHAALHHDLRPIVCVGELKKMQEVKRSRGRPTKLEVRSNILRQLENTIKGISRENIGKIIFCYEPVWAISAGTPESRHPADGAYSNLVIEKLRQVLAKKYGVPTAEEAKFIYGGSVEPSNVNEFLYQPEIDGALVGGASLNMKEFITICREASGRE